MKILPKEASIIILAKNHNPSIVTRDWLVNNKILDKIEESINIPIVSVARSKDFDLIVDPDRLLLRVRKICDSNIKLLSSISKRYIEKLPETPYKALHFKFIYEVKGNKDLKDIFNPRDDLFKRIFSIDYKIGGTVHFKFKKFSATVSLQPGVGNKIIGDFTFRFKSDDKEEIKAQLTQHKEARKKSEKILGGLFGA